MSIMGETSVSVVHNRFSVDRDILLQGCTVYGSETGPAEYGLNLKVVTVAGREVLLHQKTFIVSDAVKPFFRFIFERPLVIRAESPHIVSLIIDVSRIKGC